MNTDTLSCSSHCCLNQIGIRVSYLRDINKKQHRHKWFTTNAGSLGWCLGPGALGEGGCLLQSCLLAAVGAPMYIYIPCSSSRIQLHYYPLCCKLPRMEAFNNKADRQKLWLDFQKSGECICSVQLILKKRLIQRRLGKHVFKPLTKKALMEKHDKDDLGRAGNMQ